MPAAVVDIGAPATENERAALRFLVDGLPSTATVFTNPWLVDQGAAYELDAVVAMPHAIFVVEIKGWHGHLKGDLRDWYLPEPRRTPLQLARKTAQILHNLIGRRSYEAGKVWVQELVFLPVAASFRTDHDAVRKRVALRGELHALLQDPTRARDLASRREPAPVTNEVLNELTRILQRRTPPPLTHLANFRVIDTLERTEHYAELLGEDSTGTRRLIRFYRTPVELADEAERHRHRKHATWEAAVLRSFGRAPEDVRLLLADAPVETDDGIVVPMEYFDGQSLPAWLAQHGGTLDLKARVALWERIARTVAWTHQAGVVHRQLRPDVILLKGEPDPRDPATPDFRVTSFDLAKRRNHHTTIVGVTTTPELLEGAAPEVLLRPADATPASDQFSLGLVLAWLVLRKPLVESTLPLIERRHRVPHVRDLDPNLPARLDEAIARMLRYKPSDRFAALPDAIAAVHAAVFEPDAPSGTLAEGARVGADYVVEKRLGDGGLSEVFQVKHRLLGDRFALKVARDNDVAERALRAEYYALKSVSHPNIVRAHDLTSIIDDRLSLRLDLVPGAPLSDAVARLPAELATRRRLAEDLLAALDELERIDLSHNDLKPGNLIVRDDGRLVVIDFSLARGPAIAAKLDDTPTFGGTFDWRDPSGEPPGHAADRYAAAMCLFYLHTGAHPFGGRAPEPDEAPDLDVATLDPPALVTFFAQALAPEPTGRFRSARALRDAYLLAVGVPPGVEGTDRAPLTADTALAATTLHPRAVRALEAAQLRTLGELLAVDDLDAVPGLGPRLAAPVRELVQEALRRGVAPVERAPSGPPVFKPLAADPSPLHELGIDTAALDALRLAGLRTVGDVARRPRAALARIPKLKPHLERLISSLVPFAERRDVHAPDTLDALWGRAAAGLDAPQRQVVELVFGFAEPPVGQAEIAQRLGSDQGTVSRVKTAGLKALDRDALAPIAGAVDGFLDLDKGVLPLPLAAERLSREFPSTFDPAGPVRVLAALNTATFRLYEDVTETHLAVLARPWFTKDLLVDFAVTAARVAGGWPPEPATAARATLRMRLPEFEGDPIVLAERLVPDVRHTAGGALYQPPLDPTQALVYVLDLTRDGLTVDQLTRELERVFPDGPPPVPDDLDRALATTAWEARDGRVARREAAGPSIPKLTPDDPRAVLQIDVAVDPRDRVRDVLRDAAPRGGYRLVVAPPEHHRAIAESLVRVLGVDDRPVTAIDLADAWFAHNAGTLTADARAARFPALRIATGKRVEAMFDALFAAHGRPGATVVVHNTGVLGTLGALDQVRLLYDRVRGRPVGFWILVMPGVIHDRQPLFNERAAVWHLAGLVLPLAEPLRP